MSIESLRDTIAGLDTGEQVGREPPLEIKVKALTIGARYDEMDPEDMKKMATLMPNASNAFCPNGSHLCMWDDQEIYFKHLLKFLRAV